jgi:hypothetical protein
VSPRRAAIRSPAAPCTVAASAPRASAEHALRRASPVKTPSSTSPVPATRERGPPVGFTISSPSGAAIAVPAPLSSTTAPLRCASSRAAPRGRR